MSVKVELIEHVKMQGATVQELINALKRLTTNHNTTYVAGVDGDYVDGLTLWEETLTDGSKVHNVELEFGRE